MAADAVHFASHAMILVAALAAGFVNAIAGGGTFFSYPAFVAGGVPAALASASNNVGLWAGNVTATIAYRRELRLLRAELPFLALVTFIGSTLGAALLLWIGNAGFARLLPVLVLFATLLFAYAERVREWAIGRSRRAPTSDESAAGRSRPSWRSALGLGVVSAYGGFFGGGVNLMVMATLSLMGYRNLQQNNAVKNFLAVLIIAAVFFVFIVQGGIAWSQTIVCALGATTGGLFGARVAKRMPTAWLRGVVIAVGVALTVVYTWQYWIAPFV
jgi:uncharacterized membrane protein YfcA